MGWEINGTETHGLVLIGLGSPLMTGSYQMLANLDQWEF